MPPSGNSKKTTKLDDLIYSAKERLLLKELEKDGQRKSKKVTAKKHQDAIPTSEDPSPGQTIIWQPNSDKQIAFLSSSEDEVLYAGGRGSGKSDCLIVDPLQFCGIKRFRGLVVRRTMGELRDLIYRAQNIYPQVYPGVKWKEQEKLFHFPSGARIEFGYCDSHEDLLRYQGQEYQWLGIDEITQFPTRDIYDILKMSVRHTIKELPKTYIRATTNPSGPGRRWVKEYWVDQEEQGKRFKKEIVMPDGTSAYITYKWFHSYPWDNPDLIKRDPLYVAKLMSMDNEVMRQQWVEGSWDVSEGLAFDEFRVKTHTVAPFEIPHNWYKFRACDWGYSHDKAVTLWFTIDPSDDTIYVYREFCANGKDVRAEDKLLAAGYAREILNRESGEYISYGVVDGSIGDNRGTSGPSLDEQMRAVGLYWLYADKTPHSRKAGKMLVHQYLHTDKETGQPKLKIFNTCKELIKEMQSLELDPNNPEDVDTDLEDHAYDALRYGLMSRPNINKHYYDHRKSYNQTPIIVSKRLGY